MLILVGQQAVNVVDELVFAEVEMRCRHHQRSASTTPAHVDDAARSALVGFFAEAAVLLDMVATGEHRRRRREPV